MDRIGTARRVTDKGVSWSVGKTPSGREAVYDFDRATKVVGQPIPMSRSQAGVHRPPPKLGQQTPFVAVTTVLLGIELVHHIRIRHVRFRGLGADRPAGRQSAP